MIRRTRRWVVLAFLLTAMTGYAGGPPILTMSRMPDYFLVGKPETLRFGVRAWCCGHAPLENKSYSVRATTARLPEVKVPATPIGNSGEYVAALTLPGPGDWTVTIDYSTGATITSPPLHRKAIVHEGAKMPNLGLSSDDIAALAAFINRERLTAPTQTTKR
jgi:hypothetical protein